jgi:hypothetical protein
MPLVKQDDVYAIAKHAHGRALVSISPTRKKYRWHVQVFGKLRYSARQSTGFLNCLGLKGCPGRSLGTFN